MILQHFLGYEFVYVFLFCSMLFLIGSILIKIEIFKKLLIILFSMFFALSVCEFILSLYIEKAVEAPLFNIEKYFDDKIDFIREVSFMDKQGNKHTIINKQIDEYDKKNINFYIYDFKYSQCKGFRCTKGNENSPNSYIFLGDSFIFGDGLNDEETLPYYFSKITDFENNVVNCGARGKSINTAQNILNLDVICDFIPGDVKCFFYSFIEKDIYRNFEVINNSPSDIWIYKDNKWIMTPQPFGRIKIFFARSYIFRKLFVGVIDRYNKRFYEDYFIKSLEQMDLTVKEKYNSKLTIIIWDNTFSEYFMDKLKNTKLDLFYVPEDFCNNKNNLYKIKFDGHPSAKANEQIAEMLYDRMKQQGI